MSVPSPRSLKRYATTQLGLHRYFAHSGDGRVLPRIDTSTIIWSMILCVVMRTPAFLAVQRLVRTVSCRCLGIRQSFSDDTLHYFSERVDVACTRAALIEILRRTKRGKAFDTVWRIVLAIDGVTSGHSVKRHCSMCRPQRDKAGHVIGYKHCAAVISVVGCGLTLPFDVEPYGPGDSEYAAAQRLLRRAVALLGKRYAQHIVVDGEFATAPFLHEASGKGLGIVARLKENLPTLLTEAERRFTSQPPHLRFMDESGNRVEVWDAENFKPWETLDWEWVRVIRYRQTKPDGQVIEAYWLTNIRQKTMGSRALYAVCKSRWEIENQVFNDAKNRYGLSHIRHHDENSVLFHWLITCLAMTIERLYRLRHLHRGSHPVRSAIDMCHLLWLSLRPIGATNTS